MRRVPIRLKLAAALSVPLLALTVVTLLEVAQSAREVDEVLEQSDLASSAIGPSGLITALQNERTWAAVDLVNFAGDIAVDVEGYDATRADTDEALEEFRGRVHASGGAVEAAYGPALEGLDGKLAEHRAKIDANVEANPNRDMTNNYDFATESFAGYTELVNPFLDATTRVSLAVNDAELRQGTELAGTSTQQIETLSVLATEVLSYLFTGNQQIDDSTEIAATATLLEEFQRNAETMQNASGPYAEVAAENFPVELTDDIVAAVEGAMLGTGANIETLISALNMPDGESYVTYQRAVAERTEARADHLSDAARRRELLFAALGVVVLGTAVTLTFLVSRSITRPLRSLTRQAKDMAERRLPDAVIDILETPLGEDVRVPSVEPVAVQTRDEVADVSTALNTVQDTALDLAVEQAVLRRNIADSFVNLGRRNQNLLGRQLDFITELEAAETDSDTLANLFRLDHLATRMRRNAESLLVLAGIEPPRQWAAPVRLNDVIRAALGEVEDYQRVTVRGVEPATIVGSAAADLAHLLAELIENALVFSPPDQTVDIRGRARPDGYTLAVIDSGLGMPAQDVAAANRRLAGAESFTIAPSKYLGHYVAGNLAARHDIRVTLDNSPGNGITATVDLPPTLLTSEDAVAPADEHHAARDVWPPAPPIRITGELPAIGGPAPAGDGAAPVAPAAAAPPSSPFGSVPGGVGAGPGAPGGTGGPGGVGPFGPGPGAPTDPPPTQPAWLGTPPGAPGAPGAPAPAGPGLGGLEPERSVDEDEARRTASGLVKRTPRVVDTGEVRALGASPDDTLLASLRRVTGGRPRQPGSDQQQPPAQPPGPQPPAPQLPRRQAPGQQAPAAQLPRRQPPAALPPATQPPASQTPAAGGSTPPRGKGAPLGGLAAGLSGLSPFDPRSTGSTLPVGGARGGESSAFGDPGAGRPGGTFAGPAAGGAPGGDASGGTTSGGLARRVRGAQLPNANPLALRRSGGTPPPGAGGPGRGGPSPAPASMPPMPTPTPPPAPHTPVPQAPIPGAPAPGTGDQAQSADAVYSFLTSFTAGVQRGLDETRGA